MRHFAKILLLQHNQHFHLDEVCSIPLPVLATIVMRRGKKSVVHVAQRVAALVPVQGSSSLFPNMYCLCDLMKVSDRDRNVKVKMLVVLK